MADLHFVQLLIVNPALRYMQLKLVVHSMLHCKPVSMEPGHTLSVHAEVQLTHVLFNHQSPSLAVLENHSLFQASISCVLRVDYSSTGLS